MLCLTDPISLALEVILTWQSSLPSTMVYTSTYPEGITVRGWKPTFDGAACGQHQRQRCCMNVYEGPISLALEVVLTWKSSLASMLVYTSTYPEGISVGGWQPTFDGAASGQHQLSR